MDGSLDDDTGAIDAARASLYDDNDSADLREVCIANGISREAFSATSGFSVKRLELVLLGFRRLNFLSPYFHALAELCVVDNQNIVSMDGLQYLESLESLWLCETGVCKIESLEACARLKHLHLYGNSISKIENLDNLVALETLDVHSNKISEINTGLFVVCATLQSLNVADNLIESLDVFTQCPQTDSFNRLREFDCAGNRIRSIKELCKFSALPSVVDVALESRDFRANPVCHEPAYIHAMHSAIPGLIRLDKRDVQRRRVVRRLVHALDICGLHSATQVKRNEHDMRVSCEQLFQEYVSTQLPARVNRRNIALVQQYLFRYHKENPEDGRKQPHALKVVQQDLRTMLDAIGLLHITTNADEAFVAFAQNVAIQRHHGMHLMPALERLVVDAMGAFQYTIGRPGDAWTDPMHAFFAQRWVAHPRRPMPRPSTRDAINTTDTAANTVDVPAYRVTCVRNAVRDQACQLRIADRVTPVPAQIPPQKTSWGWVSRKVLLTPLPAPPPKDTVTVADPAEHKGSTTTTSGPSGRHAPKVVGATLVGVPLRHADPIERWLFYTVQATPTGSAVDVVTSILRDGFDAVANHTSGGRGSVPLTTHVYGSAPTTDVNSGDAASGVTLVIAARVRITSSVAMATTPVRSNSSGDVLSWIREHAPQQECHDTPIAFLPINAPAGAVQHHSADKQLVYYLFDTDLAVPEFVIEVAAPVPQMRQQNAAVSTEKESTEQVQRVVALHTETKEILQQETAWIAAHIVDETTTADGLRNMYHIFSDHGTRDSLQNVTMLNVTSLGLSCLPHLTDMPKLTTIVACGNKLEALADFRGLQHLTDLDAGENRIVTCQGLGDTDRLEKLGLRGNALRRASDIMVLSTLPCLTTLDLTENPFSFVPNLAALRANLHTRIPTLTHVHTSAIWCHPVALGRVGTPADTHWYLFHGDRSTRPAGWHREWRWQSARNHGAERRQPVTLHDATAEPVVAVSASPCVHPRRPPTSEVGAAGRFTLRVDGPTFTTKVAVETTPTGPEWMSIASVLVPSLTHMCLQDCLLTSANVLPLQHCHALADLCLSGNRLADLSFLPTAPGLWRLDVDVNALDSLEGIHRVQDSLTCLSVSHNDLSTLAEAGGLHRLEVLLAYDNALEHLRHVFSLRPLQSLRALGLEGNALARSVGYRFFVVDTLQSLEDLDGVIITAKDGRAARTEFLEQLNAEKMYDMLGGSDDVVGEAQVLDCPSHGFKVIPQLSSTVSLFRALVSVNLQGNGLTSFGALDALPNLQVLCLNDNDIKSLGVHATGSASSNNNAVFPRLTVLHLANNLISDAIPLELHRLPALSTLFLHHNALTTTRGLCNVENLTYLVLDRNRIKEIEAKTLSSCKRLSELHICSNRIVSTVSFRSLQSIEHLHLSGNRIGDVKDIVQLVSLRHMNELSLEQNPCARQEWYRMGVIQALPRLCVLDNHVISADEREAVLQLDSANDPDDALSKNDYPSTCTEGKPSGTIVVGSLVDHSGRRAPPRSNIGMDFGSGGRGGITGRAKRN
eukprot:m.1569136 g.1569136  ORF g.1569136 m.1569136 type:complete len:1528 (-) comp25298_c0_seq5:3016-7599(-)